MRDWGVFQLHQGDCIDVLRGMADASVDAVVTDPPYGLGFMCKAWDSFTAADMPMRRSGPQDAVNAGMSRQGGRQRAGAGYQRRQVADMHAFQAWCEEWAVECLRVLKPGGHLLAFGGTRTYHRMACAIEDAGFEIRDQIGWTYGSGFPKSHNGPWGGTALKPAWEPIVMARKPIVGTVAQNFERYGVGGLNIDECRVEASQQDIERASVPQPQFNSPTGKIYNMKTGEGRNGDTFDMSAGRFPANLIHDGSDEVLAAFPQAPGQQADVSHTAPSDKTGRVYGAMKRQGEPSQDSENEGAVGFKMKPGARRLDAGSSARFFYCAKANKKDREADNLHPTVKPTDLMRYLCRLVTPVGGVVLDPFTGSGSTGKAAVLEGFRFVGIEREAAYVDLAERRIATAVFGPCAFGEAA